MGNEQSGPVLSAEEKKQRRIEEMDDQMKKKYQAAKQKYNMRVIIKGDTNTGKTSLFRILKGEPFLTDHISTKQLQTTTVDWSYKATNDIVKVDVWDIVDNSEATTALSEEELKKQISSSMNSKSSTFHANVDSSVLDIYKQTHAVIFMMDPVKKWTLDYIKRELPKVPQKTFILIVQNYKDKEEHRAISRSEINNWVKSLKSPYVKTVEACMVNQFGLKHIITFFNLPFLQLQRETLELQLQQNREEHNAVEEELGLLFEFDNYSDYVKLQEITKKQNPRRPEQPIKLESPNPRLRERSSSDAFIQPSSPKPLDSPKPAPAVNSPKPSISAANSPRPTTAPATAPTVNSPKPTPTVNSPKPAPAVNSPKPSLSVADSPRPTTPASPPVNSPKPTETTQQSGLFSRFISAFSSPQANPEVEKKKEEDEKIKKAAEELQNLKRGERASKSNPDDFIPEGGDIDNWLDDEGANIAASDHEFDSDDEDRSGLITQYEEPTPFELPTVPKISEKQKKQQEAQQKKTTRSTKKETTRRTKKKTTRRTTKKTTRRTTKKTTRRTKKETTRGAKETAGRRKKETRGRKEKTGEKTCRPRS